MGDDLKQMMGYSLYANQITSYLKKHKIACKVITYNKVKNFKTIDQMLGKDGCCVLLYLSKEGYGHYVSVFKRGKSIIEVFDSYKDMKPDQELKYVSKEENEKFHQDNPYLTALLYTSGKQIHYNNYAMQKMDNNISTCGRWAIVRILHRDKSIDAFNKWIKSECAKWKMTPDELVTSMTRDIKMRA